LDGNVSSQTTGLSVTALGLFLYEMVVREGSVIA
jgi:hypothetical protein